MEGLEGMDDGGWRGLSMEIQQRLSENQVDFARATKSCTWPLTDESRRQRADSELGIKEVVDIIYLPSPQHHSHSHRQHRSHSRR